jgi:ketosteroid isomerase-like protein
MKKGIYLILALFVLHTAHAQSKDSIQVAKAVNHLAELMVNPDKAALEALVSDQVSYGHSGGKLEGRTSFIESLTSGSSDFVKINLTDQTIQLFGKTAIVRNKLFASTNDGGKPGEVKLALILVWQKQQKTWQLIARQAVKLP